MTGQNQKDGCTLGIRVAQGFVSLVLAFLSLTLLIFAICCLVGVLTLSVLVLVFAFVANPSGFKEAIRIFTREMRALIQKLTELGEFLMSALASVTGGVSGSKEPDHGSGRQTCSKADLPARNSDGISGTS